MIKMKIKMRMKITTKIEIKSTSTSSAGHGCPNIAGVERHRRHIDGTRVTHERPAIYATYAIYVPPMLSAHATVNVRFSGEGSRGTAQRRRAGLVSVLKTHFLVIFWGVYLLSFSIFVTRFMIWLSEIGPPSNGAK